MDGHQQRNALTAAEQALKALARGDGVRAVRAAERAHELDQIDLYGALPEAVTAAVADLGATGVVGPGSLEMLRAAVGVGPLQGLVEQIGDAP